MVWLIVHLSFTEYLTVVISYMNVLSFIQISDLSTTTLKPVSLSTLQFVLDAKVERIF